MTTLAPMRIRARLAAGLAHAGPWGIALDGLLAGEVWAAEKERQLSLGRIPLRAMDSDEPPPDLELPLARCEPEDGPWHWAATCARPPQPPQRIDIHMWTGRVDSRSLEQAAAALPKIISSRQGRYRARRMPLLVTPCSEVVWHAVGDIDEVTRLLTPIRSIGKKRTSGEGQVLDWTITDAPDLDELTAAHLHPDGTLGRTTPASCRGQFADVVDGGRGTAGIRPPYMHPSRQLELYLPARLDDQR